VTAIEWQNPAQHGELRRRTWSDLPVPSSRPCHIAVLRSDIQ